MKDIASEIESLTDLEKEFVDYLLSEVTLHELEIKAKFGDQYQKMRNDLKLRRIVADMKINRKRRGGLVDYYRLEETVKTIPLCIKTLVDIMHNGKEHNRVAAASKLIGPSLSYLEKLGVNVADIAVAEGNEDKFNFTLNVTPINGSKSN